MKVLVVEDEVLLAKSIQALLQSKGFQVECVYNGLDGTEYALTGVYDLLILDVMMPKVNGFEVARRVRHERCGTPILMLTAKSDLDDRIEGLNAGADYYLTKPFDTRELLACVNALLRRQGAQVNELSIGQTRLDLNAKQLVCEENSIRLSAKEYDVMRILMQSKGAVVPKEAILSRAWGLDSDVMDNNVEVYIAMLRKKLAHIGSPAQIRAIRRMGYIVEE